MIHAKSTEDRYVRELRRVRLAQQMLQFGVRQSWVQRAHRQIADDSQALAHAVQEGVTGNPRIGAGNGLFGTYRLCAVSMGTLQIHSGYANLTYSEPGGLQVHSERIPYAGTLVVGRVCFAKKGAV